MECLMDCPQCSDTGQIACVCSPTDYDRVTQRDRVTGEDRQTLINRRMNCNNCVGSGAIACPTCHGRGCVAIISKDKISQ